MLSSHSEQILRYILTDCNLHIVWWNVSGTLLVWFFTSYFASTTRLGFYPIGLLAQIILLVNHAIVILPLAWFHFWGLAATLSLMNLPPQILTRYTRWELLKGKIITSATAQPVSAEPTPSREDDLAETAPLEPSADESGLPMYHERWACWFYPIFVHGHH